MTLSCRFEPSCATFHPVNPSVGFFLNLQNKNIFAKNPQTGLRTDEFGYNKLRKPVCDFISVLKVAVF